MRCPMVIYTNTKSYDRARQRIALCCRVLMGMLSLEKCLLILGALYAQLIAIYSYIKWLNEYGGNNANRQIIRC